MSFKIYLSSTLIFTLIFSSCISKLSNEKLNAENSVSDTKSVRIWWEGENIVKTNFPEAGKSDFSPKNKDEADKLSEGQWLAANKTDQKFFAEYNVNIPVSGNYSLWTRKFWKHGPFKWRFDDGKWNDCSRDIALADNVELRKFVCANWVFLGEIEIDKGKYKFEIKLDGKEGPACFDSFLLTNVPFIPRGKVKPGQKYNKTEKGWFAFEPELDNFRKSMIDLRWMNEKYAGEYGRISASNGHFIHSENDRKIKFWAVNAGGEVVKFDKASVQYLARHLAGLGVNMIRVHSAPFKRNKPTETDKKYLDKLHYFVYCMKKNGIYTKLSFYFPLWLKVNKSMNIPGFNSINNKTPFALLFFLPQMQKIYKNWLKNLLNSESPYTGDTLAEDPAVAMVEIINEDNYFFWTFKPYQTIPAECMHVLEKKFGDWLINKYGSLKKASELWKNKKLKGDNFSKGRVGLYGAWQMKNSKGNPRAVDQIQFLTENQKNFYSSMKKYFKKELEYEGLVSASNWQTAAPRTLGPLDKYTNSVCDLIDRHAYWHPMHKGPRASFSINKNDKYKNGSLLTNPQKTPFMEILYNNKPHIVSEYNYPMPNRFRAESVIMTAVFGSLQGTRGWFHFALSSPGWLLQHSKFSIQTPVIMGQFPAGALMFRNNYIKEGKTVVKESLNINDLYKGKKAAISSARNLDEFRKNDIPEGGNLKTDELDFIDPLAFYVGKVERYVSDDKGKSEISDISPFVNRKKQTIQSSTDEIFWNYDDGILKVNTPRTQGAVGFLNRENNISFPFFNLKSENEYASVFMVSMDGKPLEESSKILLQIMTEDKNFKWKTNGVDVLNIADLGGPPIIVKNISGYITFNKNIPKKITALNFNGTPKKQMNLVNKKNLKLLKNSFYYIIEN